MSTAVVTTIDVEIEPQREPELLAGFRQISMEQMPAGLLASELLRGRDGAWRIQTTWRDMDALLAVRDSGERPAALALLDSLQARHSHAIFTVMQRHLA